MTVETSFNMLVKLARANKLTWDEHQKVTEAIETVLSALNDDNNIDEVLPLKAEKAEKKNEK